MVLSSTVGTAAVAQDAQGKYTFNIASKPVTQAVIEVGEVTGLAVVIRENESISLSGRSVRGSMTAEQALATLLAGTGLKYRFGNGNTIHVFKAVENSASPVEDVTTLAPIVVQGRGATTEGTGSYRTDIATLGKMKRKLREIPNSVSVTSRQQMDDRQLNSIQDVVEATNGATLIKADDVNERSELHFRGFRSDSLQVDGSSISPNNDVTSFDTAIYDRIEILHGPAGIMQGARELGGTINMVRKKPTETQQIKIDGEIGAWDQRRMELDVGGPISEDGGIRGRAVGVWDKGGSFIDLVNYDRQLAYGVLEFDVTDQTLMTVGAAWQQGEGRNSRGLPAYADGTLLDVPRSTYAGMAWDHSKTRSAEVFSQLEHEFDSGAMLNLSASYLDRSRDGKMAFGDGAVDPVTGIAQLLPEYRIDTEKNFNFDSSLSIPFELGGLSQKVLIGADYHTTNEGMDRARQARIPLDIFNPDYGLPEPTWNFNRFEAYDTKQFGIYGQAQLKPVEWGTIILGGRLNWWDNTISHRLTGVEMSHASFDGQFTPYVAAIVDISDTTSLYASYASIYVPQDAFTADNEVIAPREGEQYEFGLKSELFDGHANASIALFQVEDSNRAVEDPADPDASVAAGKVRSRGIEAEIAGELLPSWQVIAGYTYMTSKYVRDPDNSGVFEPRAPRHSVRLWNKYTVETGTFEGLSIGGGIRAFSDIYRIDDVVKFSRPGYAVVDLQFGYQFNENVKASLTVTNLFDKKYYQSVGYAERQSYYGEPRAVSFKLSSKF